MLTDFKGKGGILRTDVFVVACGCKLWQCRLRLTKVLRPNDLPLLAFWNASGLAEELLLCFDVIFSRNPEASFIGIVHCSYSQSPNMLAPSHFIQFVTLKIARLKQSIPAGDLLPNGLHVARSKLVLLSLFFCPSFLTHVPQTNILLPFDLSKRNLCLLCKQAVLKFPF